MVIKYSNTSSRMFLEKDGVKRFDSAAFPVQFYPLDKAITGPISFSFSDFNKANAYGFARGLSPGSNYRNSCSSFVTIPYQEWGPSELLPAPDYILPDVVIGVVPGIADLLNIRLKVTRTNTPSQVNGEDLIPQLKAGEWVDIHGGAALIEMLPPIMRMVRIMLSPTLNGDGTRNVILRRTQSVRRTRYTYWRSDGSASNSGWTHGGDARSAFGHIVSRIQLKDEGFLPDGSTALARNGARPCSLTDNTNYASTYSGEISITPGVSLITPETAGGGGAGKLFMLVDQQERSNAGASTHTFTGVDLAYPAADRKIFVMVVGLSLGNTSNNDISSVTVAGTAATQITRARSYLDNIGSNDETKISAIYRCALPSGDTGNVVVNFSGGYQFCRIYVFVAYGLEDAGVAFSSVNVTQNSTNYSLTTPADGFVIGAAVGPQTQFPMTVTGFSSYFEDLIFVTNPAAREYSGGWVNETTSSGTIIARINLGGGSGVGNVVAMALASFR